MLFVSPVFLFLFLPAVFLIHALLPMRIRNAFLALASFAFYAWGGLAYAFLILVSVLVNYALGRLLGVVRNPKARKAWLVLAVVYNLGILGFFKYFTFAAGIVASAVRTFDPGFMLQPPLIPLPIGISFFTFMILSYAVDIYRGHVKDQRNFTDLALYILLFPHLIAGPIVRYADIQDRIAERRITAAGVAAGVERFLLGFAKKLIVADAMARIAGFFFDSPVNLSTPGAWLGALAYALQIYFDFSAYSDMAIGLAKMFGFDFRENFDHPYAAASVQEFWRRWHISLSSWFRDYLYIPLGGNRKGAARTYLNLLVVFFATGLWHGASWNFVLWGLFHGAFLILERAGLSNLLRRLPRAVGHVYTLFAVVVGWVLFRTKDLPAAGTYLKAMFVPTFAHASRALLVLDGEAFLLLAAGILFSLPLRKAVQEAAARRGPTLALYRAGVFALFLVAVLYMTGSKFNPFIYFVF